MIKQISVFFNSETNPYRNLAVEEYLTKSVSDDELILYLWQNEHTIVVGRNQNVWKECNVESFLNDNGKIVRRLSGGGAVYHDLGNLNFTFCAKVENYNVDKQLAVIIRALTMLGIIAQKTGRNDITIDGKKFSGNAFYQTGDCCYHHGTLLVDVDFDKMTKFLNVDKSKLQSKGVDSVRARVTNLKEYRQNISIDELKNYLIKAVEQEYQCPVEVISDAVIEYERINVAIDKFSQWNWIYGRKINFTYQMKERFSWGNIELGFFVEAGCIKDLEIFSDGLNVEFIDILKTALLNCVYRKVDLKECIERIANDLLDLKIRADLIDLIDKSM